MSTWRKSLQWRVLLVTWLGMALALLLTGVVLHHLFSGHVQRQFEADLSLHLEQLTARLEFDAQGRPVVEAHKLSDPRWLKPLSGRYWQIGAYPHPTDAEADTPATDVLRSRSLWDEVLHLPPDVIADGSTHRHTLAGPDGQTLMALERTIRPPAPHTGRWTLVVAADARDTQAAIHEFAYTLSLALLLLFVLLTLASAMQVGVGLSPLRRLQHAVLALERGDAVTVEGQFPAEIQPLVDGFNRTLQRQAQSLSRARTQAGNLAHALKTPLAIMRHTADQLQDRADSTASTALAPLGQQLHEQVDRAQQHIDWHLRRARCAAHAAAPHPRCALWPVLHGLQRVMDKVYAQRHLTIALPVPMPTVRVRIEEEDLHDMLGNLIDNACKWAHHRVEIHITATGDVFIDDDGPGVPPEQWPHLGQRGQRLDEHTPGSGLGLAIVTELVEVYEAQLRFDRSPLGGLRVHLSGLNSCG